MDRNETIGKPTEQMGVMQKNVLDTQVIEIFKSDKLRVTPEIAEVSGNGLIGFKAVGVDVRVFLPHQKLLLVIPGSGGKTEKVPDPYVFDLKADETKMFRAVDESTLVAYHAVRTVFNGYTEALSRPPVIIIVQTADI